jgi:hypothetical protein
MRLGDFRSLVDRLVGEVPREYLDGIVEVEVSANTVPHPLRPGVYTMGECVPLEWSGDGTDLQSRVVLYHGSFQALAEHDDFDWRDEAWETLTHELQHHLEWRARVELLERYDWAAEQNFARHAGELFDPGFYRAGEELGPGVYRVDDDVFMEHAGNIGKGDEAVEVRWHGRSYRVPLVEPLSTPAFVILEGLAHPPPGQAVVVLTRAPSILDLWRRTAPAERVATVQPSDG